MQGMGGYPGMMNPKRPKLDRKFSDKTGFRVLLPSKVWIMYAIVILLKCAYL